MTLKKLKSLKEVADESVFLEIGSIVGIFMNISC